MKPGDPEYTDLHKWLRKQYGIPLFCENVNCLGISSRFEYSLIRGKKYEYMRENFQILCISCHRRYDDSDERKLKISIYRTGKSSGMKGKCHSKETKLKISKAGQGRINSMKHRKSISEANRINKLRNRNCIGRKMSRETRMKISRSHIKYHEQIRNNNK